MTIIRQAGGGGGGWMDGRKITKHMEYGCECEKENDDFLKWTIRVYYQKKPKTKTKK